MINEELIKQRVKLLLEQLEDIKNKYHSYLEGVGIRITDASSQTNDDETECPSNTQKDSSNREIEEQNALTKSCEGNAEDEMTSLPINKNQSLNLYSPQKNVSSFLHDDCSSRVSFLSPYIQQETDEVLTNTISSQNAESPVGNYIEFENTDLDKFSWFIVLNLLEGKNDSKE